MTIDTALSWSQHQLTKTDSAVLDAEVLLGFVLKKEKSWLLTHLEKKLSAKQLKKFQSLAGRRARHEPVAYLTGHKEFYCLDFVVNKNVLIPRPETEMMIDYLALRRSEKQTALLRAVETGEAMSSLRDREAQHQKEKEMIVDVGTGSGCLAVTAAKLTMSHPERKPKNRVRFLGWSRGIPIKILAIDSSAAALQVAKNNARRHGVTKQIKFLKNDLLKGLRLETKNDLLILANLPYLPIDHWRQAPPDVRLYEPKAALAAGRDGLKLYRELIKQIAAIGSRLGSNNKITALLEIDPHQVKKLAKIIKMSLPRASLEIRKDLQGLARLVIVKI